MTGLIDSYIEAKYGDGGPGGGRFEENDDEIHPSQLGRCEKELWHDRRDGKPDEASVYFELGRVFELLYGAALAWEHGDLSRSDLHEHRPWELPGLTDAIQQDVGIDIWVDNDLTIPGESDWVVYEDGAEPLDKVKLDAESGDRLALRDGEVSEYGGEVAHVVEAKTKNDVSKLDGPQEEHLSQLAAYMWAFDAPGSVDYVERDDMSLASFRVEPDEAYFMDAEFRAKSHRENLRSDEPPEPTPTNRWACYYCAHRGGCGGSLW